MTAKELMYLEDSLGMEQQLQTQCNDYASKVSDQSLKNVLTELSMQHANHYNCLLNQLNNA